jgi:hypothetical protein
MPRSLNSVGKNLSTVLIVVIHSPDLEFQKSNQVSCVVFHRSTNSSPFTLLSYPFNYQELRPFTSRSTLPAFVGPPLINLGSRNSKHISENLRNNSTSNPAFLKIIHPYIVL